MDKVKHEWQHEMLEIYGAAIEELLRELKTVTTEVILNKLMKRIDDLHEKYEKEEQLDAKSWIKNGVKNRGK